MHKRAVLISCLLGLTAVRCERYDPKKPAPAEAHVLPDYIKALSLFMEKPTTDFISSLTKEEASAVGKAKAETVGNGFTSELLSTNIGKYSASAKAKFDQMIAALKNMLTDVDERTREALHQLHELTSNLEKTPTKEQVEQWIVNGASIMSSLTPEEQATIEKDLPHMGSIMLHTSFLKVKNTADSQTVIRELVEMFNQHLIIPH
ncbi:hypothetical protein QR680_013788 [Steinernema hermaphroditum]|uniref:SXP/RAL-2 family protein Ani s 5-like cation-binding domain-containing protein n=1 Tax=Steinernema hermaphroditum TaxID=289476 RepID=A0AA39M345_9BILA|nr:hypothetical protein QR680_013788 [Steinernema hermaphroditum]